MTARQRLSMGIAVSGALMIAVALFGTDPADGQNKPVSTDYSGIPRPIVDTHHLMDLFNKPLYKYLKEAMQEKPTQEKGWETISERGLQAAEVMNLVAIRERNKSEQSDWQRHVQTAQQAGLQLNDAAKSQNWKLTQQAYQGLIRNCNDCHQQIAPDHAPQIQP